MKQGKCCRCKKARGIYLNTKLCRSCTNSERKWRNNTIRRYWDRLEAHLDKAVQEHQAHVPPFSEEYQEEYLRKGLKKVKTR